jgi:hypothetical protein
LRITVPILELSRDLDEQTMQKGIRDEKKQDRLKEMIGWLAEAIVTYLCAFRNNLMGTVNNFACER